MSSPRHLWTGPWREDSERARDEADRRGNEAATAVLDIPAPPTRVQPAAAVPPPSAPVRPAAGAAPTPPPRRPRTGLYAAGAVLTAAVAVLTVLLLRDDSNTTKVNKPVNALPALQGSTIKPSQGQTRAGAIYAKTSPAVVSIRTAGGSGTGFLVGDRSTVVTNAHVVETATTVTIRFGPEGDDISGQVLGTDPSSDLAVVRIPSGSAPASSKPLALADSDQVRVGDDVVAIGNPFGLDRTLTEGIISAKGREIEAPNGFAIEDALQTDAPINPGNSGGPLLDDTGRVVGVNSQIETGGTSSGNLGIGFAVSSNTVRQVVPQLKAGRTIDRAWLGVQTQASAGGEGAEIASLVTGGPAEQSGLQTGDVILSVGGQAIQQPQDVARIIADITPGKRVAIKVRRGSDTPTIDVQLGTRPSRVP